MELTDEREGVGRVVLQCCGVGICGGFGISKGEFHSTDFYIALKGFENAFFSDRGSDAFE